MGFGYSDTLPDDVVVDEVERLALTSRLAAQKQAEPEKPKVLGLMSCSTERHFLRGVQAASPERHDSRNELLGSDGNAAILASMHGLLGMICEPQYSRLVNGSGDEKRMKVNPPRR